MSHLVADLAPVLLLFSQEISEFLDAMDTAATS